MLLRYGADAKAGNNQKQTPLAFAMAQGAHPPACQYKRVLEYLSRYGIR